MSSRSEREWIQWISRRFPSQRPEVRLAIGDDSALLHIPAGFELLSSCDLLVERIDFLQQRHGSRLLGEKVLEVNLSDLAACGGTPVAYSVAVAFPPDLATEWVESLFCGMGDAAARNRCDLIGGDLSATSGPVFIAVTVLGTVLAGRAVRRQGARPGDRIVLTGSIGKSATGLRLLERFPPAQPLSDQAALDAWSKGLPVENSASAAYAAYWHLAPQSAIAAGQEAAALGATSMIDLSDGLSIDLGHLADSSQVGLVVNEASLPIDPCVSLLQPAEREAVVLHGGEEYELAFTLPAQSPLPQAAGHRLLHCIGFVEEEAGLRLRKSDGTITEFERRGFQHF